MTDQKPSVINVRDDLPASVFRVSGSVGVSPNRPVCITGNMRVHQVTVVADTFIGVVLHSGAEGEEATVQEFGNVKSYITGTVTAGDALVATGSSTAACFKTNAAISAVSGSTYWTSTLGVYKIGAQALQNGTDGDQIMIRLQ